MELGFVAYSSFSDIVDNIETLRLQYEEVLASFSNFEQKQKHEYMRLIKKEIYSLKMLEWKKDKIWEYINGLEYIDVLKNLK